MEMEPTHMGNDGGVDNISWTYPYSVGSTSFPQGWTSRGATNQGRGSKEEVGESPDTASQQQQHTLLCTYLGAATVGRLELNQSTVGRWPLVFPHFSLDTGRKGT